MDPKAFLMGMCAIGASISVLVAFGAGLGEGIAAGKAVEAVGRQPEAQKQITSTMILGQAITESNSIYGLLVSLLLIFVLSGKLG